MFKKLVETYANILHIRFTDTFANLPPATLNQISRNNVLARLWWVVQFLLGRLVLNLILPGAKNENITGKVWLYVLSKNNYESLRFIKEQLPEAVFVAGQNKDVGIYRRSVNRLSTRYKIFYYYKFPILVWGLYKLKGKRALRFFDLIFLATGYYELSLRYLKKYKPNAIIFANDHNTDARALLLAAKKLKIPTIYIQHASVSTSFPPLQFDLSLLEGEDSLNKYRQCGSIKGAVKLIGMPKADSFLPLKNTGTTIQNLGICANIIDDTQAIKELVEAVSRHFPELTITFRPHPGDRRDFSFINNINPSIIFSDGKQEQVFDFLIKQDALIAADSSIHLEATMLNILSLYYRFGTSNFTYDYYGFLKQNLIEAASDIKDLITKLEKYKANRPEVYQRAKYYNAILGSEFEGRSHELALNQIKIFLAEKQAINA
ncbi:hypothetical protein [Adhaeribacter aquaticus]|uniref:hypothetical protein n=1 Tax=Adhaeribacter aquaticus TaxID=299567 RepID=UPI000403E05F|nr:hypothetical protein [Adhaeribacter aquaticus]